MYLIIGIFVFLFGLIIGSFLNVVIVRVPKKESLFTRSHCPKCRKIISWYQNIPIISYLFLKGRCAGCRQVIPITYPLVELIAGMSAFLLLRPIEDFLPFFHSIILFATVCVFLCHFIIDLRHQILPDGLNLYLGLLFLLNSFLFLDWKFSLFGAILGFSFPYLITHLFYLVKKQVGMGGGDIKLYAVLGLYLGPLGIMQNIFLSSLLGCFIFLGLLLLKKKTRNDPIPFGPFIIVAASAQIFFPKFYTDFASKFFLIP